MDKPVFSHEPRERIDESLDRAAIDRLARALANDEQIDAQVVKQGLEALFTERISLDTDRFRPELPGLRDRRDTIEELKDDVDRLDRDLKRTGNGIDDICSVLDDCIEEIEKDASHVSRGLVPFLIEVRHRLNCLR